MTRLVQFADSFTSASAPSVGAGTIQEKYTIANNASLDLFTVNSTNIRTVEAIFRLERKTDSGIFAQSGSFKMHFDGTIWSLTFGNYDGAEMAVVDFVVSVEQVKFEVDGTGTLSYLSGNMVGANYQGKLNLFSIRIAE